MLNLKYFVIDSAKHISDFFGIIGCGVRMHQFLYLLSNVISFFIVGLQLMMFIRAILSWIVPDDDNPLLNFVTAVTEPVIFPIRMLLERFEFFAEMPIDVSFYVAFLLLVLIENLLPTI